MYEYFLDTNVLIHLLRGEESIAQFLHALGQDTYFISSISHLEVLLGHEKDKVSLNDAERFLSYFSCLPVDAVVASESAALAKSSKKKMLFKDMLIAATAKVHKKKILTFDKDFQKLKGVNVELLSLEPFQFKKT